MIPIDGIPLLHKNALTKANYTKRLVRHVTAPAPSCLDNVETRARLAIERMLPHDVIRVEGVLVTKTTHSTRKAFVYTVAGSLPCDLDDAVAAVVAQAEGGQS